jgi:predicted HicB family RNase H-like nuclease
MAYSEAQKRATMKYNAAAYDRIELRVPKGRKADIEAHAKTKGESINGLVNSLIREDMGLSDAEWKETQP